MKKNVDGSIDIITTVTFADVKLAYEALPSSGRNRLLKMRQDFDSWFQAQFTVNVPQNADQIKVTRLPHFQRHYDVMS